MSAAAEASPPTRREGAPAPGHAALALAATELQASGAQEAAFPARGRRVSRVVAILGVLAIGGVYGGMRLLGDSKIPGPEAPPPSAVSSSATKDSGGAPLVDSFDAAAAASAQPEPPTIDAAADAASDAADDASTSADATSDAAPESPRRTVPLDEFQDPWVKSRPAASPR